MRHDPIYQQMSNGQVRAILTNVARRELNRLMSATDTAHLRSFDEGQARITALEAELETVRAHAQMGSPSAVADKIEAAAAEINLALPCPLTPQILRPASSLCEDLLIAAMDVERGRSVQHVAAGVLPAITTLSFEDVLKPPALLSDACRLLKQSATASMSRSHEASSALLLELVGDIPVDQLDFEAQKQFAVQISRLPRDHGKAHGRNRFERAGITRSKADEITRADDMDRETIARIDALDIPLAEKRHRLRGQLCKRLTDTTVLKHHRAIRRLLQLAREKLNPPASSVALSDAAILDAVREAQPKDDLFFRVVDTKTRASWSAERIASLFTSPIYRGCAGPKRRWKGGPHVIRDATYWVPLILLTTGLRPEEALRLRRTWVVKRDGIICLLVGGTDGTHVKTDTSHRIVPIPQVLLDLGFLQWVNSTSNGDEMLFPDAAARTEKDKLSDVFGKHLRLLLDRLGLRDSAEDLYATRRTFQIRLKKAGVEKGDRQCLIGHRTHTDTVDAHYTDLDVRHLKSQIDLVDYGLEIAMCRKAGHPVIRDCALGGAEQWSAQVELGHNGAASRIALHDAHGRATLDLLIVDQSCVVTRDGVRSIVPLADGARLLDELETLARISPPGDADARQALEHFRTYGG